MAWFTCCAAFVSVILKISLSILRLVKMSLLSATKTYQRHRIPRRMEPKPGWFTVTTTEPDMITYDDNPFERRAKFYCGHVISSKSLKEYCAGQLSKGELTIQCPAYGCKVSWHFSVVKYILQFSSTAEELQEFETKVSENYINKLSGVEQCPDCSSYLDKSTSVTNCVECPVCSSVNGFSSYFCWLCLQPWKSNTNSKKCGNANCATLDKRLGILANCPVKIILNRSTPSIRACPKCGLLIEYNQGCSQMCCTSCKHYFCFFCLQGASSKSALICVPYDSTCIIARRQTTLPKM